MIAEKESFNNKSCKEICSVATYSVIIPNSYVQKPLKILIIIFVTTQRSKYITLQ